MGKLVGLVLLGAVVAGVGFAAYNQLHYDRLQPFPVTWNHLPEELLLLELERGRRDLMAKIASTQRMAAVGGVHMPLEATAGHVDALTSELAALDQQIATLRAEIAATQERR